MSKNVYVCVVESRLRITVRGDCREETESNNIHQKQTSHREWPNVT